MKTLAAESNFQHFAPPEEKWVWGPTLDPLKSGSVPPLALGKLQSLVGLCLMVVACCRLHSLLSSKLLSH